MTLDRYTDRIRYNGGGAPGGSGPGGGAGTTLSYITAVSEGTLSNESVFGATVFYPPDILANRPAASATIVGAMYFATDGGGVATRGTLYRSDGVSTWELIGIDKEYADALYQATGASAGGDLTGTYPNPTITTDAVTYAKMQNISATDRLLGRDTVGAGDTEELTVTGGVEFTGSGGIQRSALTGDVTASAGSNGTTVVNDAVTFAKMQNIATDTLIGRDTAATGDPESITVTQGLEFNGSQQLVTNPMAGIIRDTMGDTNKTITAPTTLLAAITAITATRTITLPAANAYAPGAHIVIVDSGGGVSSSAVPPRLLTIQRAGSDTINGSLTTWSIGATYGSVILGTDGISKWIAVDTSVYIDRQEFTSSGTWTMPPNAMMTHVRVVGGGASGASGRLGVTSSERHGGGGGGGGGATEIWLDPADIGVTGTTVTVTIGAQQTTVGAARSGAAANGQDGSAGNDSSFGTIAVGSGGQGSFFAPSGGTATDPNTASSSGANTTTYANSGFTASGTFFFTASAGGRAAIAAATFPAAGLVGGLPGGGAAGASLTSANANIAALAGGVGNKALITGGSLGTIGVAGGNGTDSPNPDGGGAGGGGGGNQTSSAANAGAGGDGGAPGGGGGGGGAGTQGGAGTSGAGGKGAKGYCVVDTICARGF